MLIRLQIENYALIELAEIEFGPGFNVLTGETGSGKSIIVDALGLLLGERAEAGVIRTGASQATVTGWFPTPFTAATQKAWCAEEGMPALEEEIRLRREITAEASGGTRSRGYVDHQMAGLGVLRRLARHLGEIHSQHEALVSFTPAAQLELLDRFASVDKERAAAAAAYAEWRQWTARLREATGGEQLRQQQADLWRFQKKELDAARVQASEDAALEQERLALANAEKILAAVQAGYGALYEDPEAALRQLRVAQRQVQELQRFLPAIEDLGPRLEALQAETADVAEQLRAAGEAVEASPARLAEVEERLLLLDRMKRKYGPTIEDVLRHQASLDAQLERLENHDAEQTLAASQVAAAATAYRQSATALSRRRRTAAETLARQVEAEVTDLAMKLRFEVNFAGEGTAPEAEWTAQGWDQIQFLASTNPGEPLAPVAEIASGGELSRLLLALHLVAQPETAARTAAPRTLVLDEVDAGIGGRAAEAVGRKLQRLGRHYQVLCVTHLAPIATFAEHQIHVEKIESGGRTRTTIATLDQTGREQEIARMLAGDQANETALRHARELLAAAHAPQPAKRARTTR